MKTEYIFLSIKNLRRRGLRSWLTMLGIFIGIAAVISLISLGNGLRSAVIGQFSDLSTDKLTITSAETGFGPPGAFAVKKLNEHDLKLIEGVSGVKMVISRLVRAADVKYNEISLTKYLGSMPNDQEQVEEIYKSFNTGAMLGRLLNANDRGKVVLGNDFVKNDEYGKEIKIGKKINIGGRDFEIIGILNRVSTFTLNSVVLISEEDMKDVLSINDEIDLIVAVVANPDDTEAVAKVIEDKMRSDRGEKIGEEDFSVQTPVQALSSVNTILNILNIVVAGIAAISLFIGGIGIANTMFTSVLERTKEIGIMKAVGAKNSDILWIFVIEAALLGLVGGAIGILIGIGFAYAAAFIATAAFGGALDIGVTMSIPLIIWALVFSLIIGIVSGIAPAMQASKLKPVEAFRK